MSAPTATPDWADLLARAIRGEDLDGAAASSAMTAIMAGDVPPVRVAALLVALRAKGETAEEIAGLVSSMRRFALSVAAPADAGRYLVPKGSVTVDGASLTVVDVTPGSGETDEVVFRIALIPHTLEVTTFGDRGVGDRVNLEVDVIAKYVERLLAAGTATPYDALEES